MCLLFHPHSPGWALNFHVAEPPCCPFPTVVQLSYGQAHRNPCNSREDPPALPPNRKALLCLTLLLIPGAGRNNEVCMQLLMQPMMHEAGNQARALSSVDRYIGPTALGQEIIKNFLLFFSLFVISKRSRSTARGTQRGPRCVLTRCLNTYFSEL